MKFLKESSISSVLIAGPINNVTLILMILLYWHYNNFRQSYYFGEDDLLCLIKIL
ncbi:hypothetical protein CDIOL_29750 [Clostridium diolis]|uniref:Uncharacterized protein n=1 Tax=Clostridium diolis TaxID=223919 RepID=A0AAV3W3K7_9CLOT|nr:hypothetical protein CDIOL_29750 [Clostridium diolis]